ncbi:hypothetical protein [Streptomyces sp. CB03911]|uniref:hypothetical protein n=1 Tax=Streptomyces sp. CB03911 TaxID=1804758 RepID=UPI00093D6B8B|nr:hypothetical protein [Streptomyces sp. CB03911]OKI14225.1 hypothetical protein A6A07_13830 [Streptomyces sp. CB03911]
MIEQTAPAEFVPTFEPRPATTAVPGVFGITHPDGRVEYVYAATAEEALARATQVPARPAVAAHSVTTSVTPATTTVPVERPRLVEPWMVKGTVGLGLAGGGVALAPVAASAVGELAAGLGSLLQIAMEVGGLALAAVVLVRLLGGKRDGGGKVLEVTQTIVQTITQTTRIEK